MIQQHAVEARNMPRVIVLRMHNGSMSFLRATARPADVITAAREYLSAVFQLRQFSNA